MGPTVYLGETAERYRNYRRAIMAAGGHVRSGGSYIGCDALLLPGGGDMEPWRYGRENIAARDLEPGRDKRELELLDAFCRARKPILGICRGLQTINVFFGGTLIQDLPGHGTAGDLDRVHWTRTADSPLLDLYGDVCIVNSAHHQAVDQLGNGLRAVQWAPDGTVEALCHQTLPVWAVQWHPERLRGPFAKPGAADGDILFSWFLSQCHL